MSEEQSGLSLKKIVKRNLSEIAFAEYKWLALTEMKRANIDYSFDCSFFYLVNHALYNDAIAHLIKVLDTDKKSTTFWHIHSFFPNEINAELDKQGWPYEKLRNFYSLQLRLIRIKTHFHIDKDCVLNPEKVWSESNIKADDVISVIRAVRASLQKISSTNILQYNGSDVVPILIASQKAGLLKMNLDANDDLR